jgi:Leucine-rich repeat (LRR) protein
LQSLEAADNLIEDIYFMSESKQQLKFLTSADLSGNKLTKLRQLLCVKLLTLKLNNNEVSSVELKSHQSLRSISMQKNKLTSLEGFTNLRELTQLDVAENQITTLKGITECKKLKSINLSNNQIVQFDHIPNLPSLEEINLT